MCYSFLIVKMTRKDKVEIILACDKYLPDFPTGEPAKEVIRQAESIYQRLREDDKSLEGYSNEEKDNFVRAYNEKIEYLYQYCTERGTNIPKVEEKTAPKSNDNSTNEEIKKRIRNLKNILSLDPTDEKIRRRIKNLQNILEL